MGSVDKCATLLYSMGLEELLFHFVTKVLSIEVLGRFFNLEELSIESEWFKVSNSHAFSFDITIILSYRKICHTQFGWQNQAESVEVSRLTLPLKILKKVHVRVSTFGREEIDLLGCLLRSTPSLQTITLTLPRCSQYIHELSFLNNCWNVNRTHP
jgi:hypothetical protein